MKTSWLRPAALSVLVLFTSLNLWAQGSHGSLCQVAKTAKLAMDQRDDARLACLKQKKSQLNVTQCLSVANSMEYSTNAEEARLVCLYDLRSTLTAKDCHGISKAMEYADSGDDVRWECIRRFHRTLTQKQCRIFAKSMSYPANAQRAQEYCRQELN